MGRIERYSPARSTLEGDGVACKALVGTRSGKDARLRMFRRLRCRAWHALNRRCRSLHFTSLTHFRSQLSSYIMPIVKAIRPE